MPSDHGGSHRRRERLDDMHGISGSLYFAACLSHYERNPAEVERLASDLIELSTRQNFALYLTRGTILRGWARSASGDTVKGLSWIEEGIEDWRATGATLCVPFFLALKAEALYLADRISEALEAINEAKELVERSEERWWSAELYRLCAVFLAALGAAPTIKSRLLFANPSARPSGNSRLHWRNARKRPTQSTVEKKQADREKVDSDCLFEIRKAKRQPGSTIAVCGEHLPVTLLRQGEPGWSSGHLYQRLVISCLSSPITGSDRPSNYEPSTKEPFSGKGETPR